MNYVTAGQVLLGLLNILVGGALVAMIRNRPVLMKINTEREANLLNERAEEMIGMRERLIAVEQRLEQKDRLLEAERTMYRHRIANLNQAFSALLLLLKKGIPVDEAVVEIEQMRAEQLDREVAEAAMFRAAGVMADIADGRDSTNLSAAKSTKRATERADIRAGDAVTEAQRMDDKSHATDSGK